MSFASFLSCFILQPGFVFLDFLDRSKAEAAFNQLKLINFGLYYKQITVEYAKPDPNRQSIPE